MTFINRHTRSSTKAAEQNPNFLFSPEATMKNHDSFNLLQQSHEELQRLAREELGRRLTDQELHTMAEQLMHGVQPTDAFDSFNSFTQPHS